MTKPNKPNIDIAQSGALQPIKKESEELCNSRLKNGGGYCVNPAGWGTGHPGTGRCKLHGGNSLGRPKKGFSATEFDSNEILKKLERVADDDPSSISIVDNEITMLRSVFYRYMKLCHDGGNKLPDPDDLKKFTDALAKMLDVKAKLEIKAASKTPRLTLNVFITYVNEINNILKKHISNPILLNSIADDLQSLKIPEANVQSE